MGKRQNWQLVLSQRFSLAQMKSESYFYQEISFGLKWNWIRSFATLKLDI